MSVSDDTTGLRGDPVLNSPLRVGDLLVTRIGTWVIVESRSRIARSERFRPAQGFVWVLHAGRWEFARTVIDQRLRREDRVIA